MAKIVERRSISHVRSIVFVLCVASLVVTTLSLARASHAVELSSTSYRHVAGSVSAIAAVGERAPQSTAAQPNYQGSEVSVGETASVTPSGSSTSLTSILPGFLFALAGGLPTLDLDGDFAQYFLDDDDDGDGIDDVFETGTGFFVSSTNTGTSPVSADSDGDGFSDGAEVLAGSDPNEDASTPGAPQVPILVGPVRFMMMLALVLLGSWMLPMVQTGRAERRPEKSGAR